jgi:hypothetical protein
MSQFLGGVSVSITETSRRVRTGITATCPDGGDAVWSAGLRHGAIVYGFGRLWLQPG